MKELIRKYIHLKKERCPSTASSYPIQRFSPYWRYQTPQLHHHPRQTLHLSKFELYYVCILFLEVKCSVLQYLSAVSDFEKNSGLGNCEQQDRAFNLWITTAAQDWWAIVLALLFILSNTSSVIKIQQLKTLQLSVWLMSVRLMSVNESVTGRQLNVSLRTPSIRIAHDCLTGKFLNFLPHLNSAILHE